MHLVDFSRFLDFLLCDHPANHPFLEDVLQAVETNVGEFTPTALKVGVNVRGVLRVLAVMGHLKTIMNQKTSSSTSVRMYTT